MAMHIIIIKAVGNELEGERIGGREEIDHVSEREREREREREICEQFIDNKSSRFLSILPTFLMMVVTSWRYFERVKLKKVHGQRKIAATAWRIIINVSIVHNYNVLYMYIFCMYMYMYTI